MYQRNFTTVTKMHPRTAVTALLRATLQTRALRVARIMGINTGQAAEIISEKDRRARQYGLKQYGIDISHDQESFDSVLDTDDLSMHDVVDWLVDLVEQNQGTERE